MIFLSNPYVVCSTPKSYFCDLLTNICQNFLNQVLRKLTNLMLIQLLFDIFFHGFWNNIKCITIKVLLRFKIRLIFDKSLLCISKMSWIQKACFVNKFTSKNLKHQCRSLKWTKKFMFMNLKLSMFDWCYLYVIYMILC